MKLNKILAAVLALSFIFCSVALENQAQAQAQQNNQADGDLKHSSGPRRQLATIVFAGLGGAILGLSTLSFYGRPQDQLVNIAIGFAVGVIAGTAYVTVKSVSTRDYYTEPDEKSKKGAKFSVDPFITQSAETQKPDGGGANFSLIF